MSGPNLSPQHMPLPSDEEINNFLNPQTAPVADSQSLPSSGEVDQYLNEQKYGGLRGMVAAPALGLLRGATLGLSDVAFTKSGFIKPEDIKGIQEQNPGLSLTGEVGGALIPGGAGSLVGKAGKATYEGLEALKAMKTAGEVTQAAKVLGAAGSIGAHALGSAVEGSLYGGIGNTLNEYALGDPDLNGEKILANFGHGALMGGAVGTALKSASILAPPAVNAAKEGLASLKNFLIGTGEGDAGLVGSIVPEGKFSEALANRAINLDSDGKIQIVKETADHLNTIYKNLNTATKDLNQNIRPQEAEALINTASKPRVDLAKSEIISAMDETLEKMKARPAIFSPSSAAKLEDLKDELVKSIKANKDTLSDFNSLKDAKQRLGKMVFTKIPTETTEDTINALRPVSSLVNDTLKNPEVFGDVGSRLSDHDDMMSKFYEFISPNKRPTEFQKAFGSMTGRGGNAKWEFDPKKIETVFKRGNTLQGQQKMELLDRFYQTIKDIPEHMENTYANVPNAEFDSSALKNIIDNSESSVLDAHNKYLSSINNSKNGLGLRDLAAAGIAVSHPIVGAAIEAYNISRNPIEYMNKLAHIERTVGKIDQGISAAVGAIFNPALKAIGKAKGPLIRNLTNDNVEQYNKTKDRIAHLSNDPRHLIDTLSASTQDLHQIAPNMSQGLQGASIKAIQFLASKIPPEDHNPFEEKHEPSPTEIATFERYNSIVENPMLALKQINEKALIPETIETMAAVYPKLYDHMKQVIINEASNSLAKNNVLPFSTKQQLSFFLGQPIDSALKPQSIQMNQAAYVPLPQPQAQGKPSKAGMQKLTLADRTSPQKRPEA